MAALSDIQETGTERGRTETGRRMPRSLQLHTQPAPHPPACLAAAGEGSRCSHVGALAPSSDIATADVTGYALRDSTARNGRASRARWWWRAERGWPWMPNTSCTCRAAPRPRSFRPMASGSATSRTARSASGSSKTCGTGPVLPARSALGRPPPGRTWRSALGRAAARLPAAHPGLVRPPARLIEGSALSYPPANATDALES